jgi:hypothetical protein
LTVLEQTVSHKISQVCRSKNKRKMQHKNKKIRNKAAK